MMQVTTRGFRKWLTRPMSDRQRGDMKVLAHIREQYGLSLGTYGRPRMTMELKEAGLDVGERRVGRLMHINGIKPVRTHRHKVTTNSNHSLGIVANVLDGNFTADIPNRKWAGDISYVWTAQGWLYLAVVLDLHSRRVIGWAVSDRMKKDLAIQALDMAVKLRNPPQGCQQAFKRDPISACKRDPGLLWLGSARRAMRVSPCLCVAHRRRAPARCFIFEVQARFLKRQLSLPVSMISQ